MSATFEAIMPNTVGELGEFVVNNAISVRRPLWPVGGGTAMSCCGQRVADGVVVRLEKLNRVIDYPARDMTITVEAGIRMAELGTTLKSENQRLPIDVPQAEQATLGGVIATNWSGPRRFGCGTLRDYVIGISAVDASGRLFSGGGRVVKNVAGYDLCKLLVGSHGTLAIITQVTLKLRPRPETSAFVCLAFDSLAQIDAVLARLLTSATRPVAVEVLNSLSSQSILGPVRGQAPLGTITPAVRLTTRPACSHLCIAFEGTSRETTWQTETLLAECHEFEPRAVQAWSGVEADSLWSALTDFSISAESPVSFKANLLPSRTLEFLQRATEAGIAAQAHAANGIVIGHLPNDVVSAVQADAALRPLHELTRSCGGDLTVLRCREDGILRQLDAREADSSGSWMRRLKQQLDPHNLFSPGGRPF